MTTKQKASNLDSNRKSTDVVRYWLDLSEALLKEVRNAIVKSGLERRALEESVKGFAVDDISTRLDEVIGDMVREYFLGKKVSIKLFTEESGLTNLGKNPKVVGFLDEIDGTAMAFHNIPEYATTIAIIDNTKNFSTSRVIAAATVRHSDGTVYSAGKNLGSFVNGVKVRTAQRTILDDPKSMLLLDLYQVDTETLKRYFPFFEQRKLFRVWIGSAALSLAYVASGQVDAYVNNAQKLNDLGAGILLVREAGGIVTDFEGRELKVEVALKGTTPLVAASNEYIHEQIISMLR